MSLVARHLEANGLPTVIVGSALDVVEYCGVPRFLFTDFPLGNPCGLPWNRDHRLLDHVAIKHLVESELAVVTANGPAITAMGRRVVVRGSPQLWNS